MEFLKTLMLYMSLTFASSVQEAPLPEPTAVPTATPVVIAGEIIPHDEDAPAITATLPPAAGETPAPPVVATPEPRPTITPNTAYSNIRYGNRGANVKRMQERLIELGYLDGTADGAYGTKTLKALKLFQQVNGLTADGVAGDATQTQLFENPDVLPNPARVTPTPEPTQAPAPEATADAAPTIAPPQETLALLDGASIVFNGSGEALSYVDQADGVSVFKAPRMWQSKDGDVLLCLAEVAASLDDWGFERVEGGWELSAAGYAVTLLREGDALACTVDGTPLALEATDALTHQDELLVTPAFLEKALQAETLWDADEQTLMIQLAHKSVAQSED